MSLVNKKARFNYNIIQAFEAGLVLTGSEVKSVRLNKVDLSEAFVKIQNGQAYLKNAYIFPYQTQIIEDPRRDRKLLLHRSQIDYLIGKTTTLGAALVPIKLYFARNMIKLELGIGTAKQKFDHRRAIKLRDEARKIETELKMKLRI